MWRSLCADINVIRKNDPAARHLWEIVTCYPGLHALWLHRLAHRLWHWRLEWLARFVAYFSRIITQIEIHPAALIAPGVFIDHGSGVVIGETAEIKTGCTIYQGVTLGGTSLAKGVKRHPTLEESVIVGAGAKILGPFTVGHHAKVGSNAVVLRAVGAHSTVVGNPAHELGEIKTAAASPALSSEPSFCAYAIASDNADPLWQALCEQQKMIEKLQQEVERLHGAQKIRTATDKVITSA